jgi:hypothetical protein
LRSASFLFLRSRPVQALVRSTTQRCRQGVQPGLPSGRGVTARRHLGRWGALQAWSSCLWSWVSPQIVSRRGQAETESRTRPWGATLPSASPAPGRKTARSSPPGATQRGRVHPGTLWPPSSPRSGPPLSVVLTAGLAMQRAHGVGSRSAATRGWARNAVPPLPQVPSARHWAKSSETGLWGRTSWGSLSH